MIITYYNRIVLLIHIVHVVYHHHFVADLLHDILVLFMCYAYKHSHQNVLNANDNRCASRIPTESRTP